MAERISYTYGSVFDRLWAVVALESLDTAHTSGRRLVWSPEHQAWRNAYNYGAPGFFPEPANGQPNADYVASTLALLDRTGDYCPYAPQRREQCGLPIAGDHFVAPGVCGEPVLYCVQRPDKTVVSSFGGGGNMKHWGSIFGCHAVKKQFWRDTAWDDEEHVSYGEGMVASAVRDRDWCSRCTRLGEPDSAALYAKAEKAERDLLNRRTANRARRQKRNRAAPETG
jgi:hypothetical protein